MRSTSTELPSHICTSVSRDGSSTPGGRPRGAPAASRRPRKCGVAHEAREVCVDDPRYRRHRRRRNLGGACWLRQRGTAEASEGGVRSMMRTVRSKYSPRVLVVVRTLSRCHRVPLVSTVRVFNGVSVPDVVVLSVTHSSPSSEMSNVAVSRRRGEYRLRSKIAAQLVHDGHRRAARGELEDGAPPAQSGGDGDSIARRLTGGLHARGAAHSSSQRAEILPRVVHRCEFRRR